MFLGYNVLNQIASCNAKLPVVMPTFTLYYMAHIGTAVIKGQQKFYK